MSGANRAGRAGAVLVTGASSGLGREVALATAARHAVVVLLGRDRARLAGVGREVEAAGAEARIIAADVCDDAGLTAAVAQALGDDTLSLVVHAAGVMHLAPVDRITQAAARACFEVNVLGSLNVVRATLAPLSAARGRLVLVSSIAGVIALPGGFAAYGASKWALRGLGEILRPELAARGVGLTLAYPAILDTPMVRALGDRAPGVYRAFPWHPARAAAWRLLHDAGHGRRESYSTWLDRAGARLAATFPRPFHALLRAFVRWRGGDPAAGGRLLD